MPSAGLPELADGSVDMDGTNPATFTHNGHPLTAARKVAVAVEGAPVDPPHNGFAYDAAGKMCVSLANPVVLIHNGFGYDAAGRVCIVGGAGPFVQHGAQFDADGKLRATVA